MSDDHKKMKIENLIFKLNHLGLERQQKFDELWELEKRSNELRKELLELIDHGLEDI